MDSWRVGGHWGRTIIKEGDGEVDENGHRPDDRLIGVMDTPEDAALVVLAVSQYRARITTPGLPRPMASNRMGILPTGPFAF